jgi:hypothetical protein
MPEDKGKWDDTGPASHTDTRFYVGFSSEVDKLPREGVATGSMAFCVDTGDAYIYHGADDTWHQM